MLRESGAVSFADLQRVRALKFTLYLMTRSLAKKVRRVRARLLVDKLGRQRLVRLPEYPDADKQKKRNEERKEADRYCWP